MVQARSMCLAGVLALALGAAACSSSTSSGTGGATSSSTGSASAAAASSECVTKATTAANAARAVPPLVMPTGTFDMKSNAGKSVWLIDELPIPELVDIANGWAAAAKAAGLQAHIDNTTGTVSSWSAGVSQAISAGAAGIVLLGVPWQVVTGPLATAAAKKIPVVQFSDGDQNDATPSTIYSHITSDFNLGGEYMADWVLANSNCQAHVAYLSAGTGAGSSGLEVDSGFANQLHALCTSCTLAKSDVDIASLATQLPGATQSLLRRYPDTNYVVSTFDSLVTFIQPSVAQAGSSAKIVAHDGAAANLQTISQGGAQAADVALPPPGYQGWLLMDSLGRGMLGLPATNEVIVQRLIDKTNVSTSINALFPDYANYQQDFEKLWGLS
jgi:ribose transport system substrate-binding protein